MTQLAPDVHQLALVPRSGINAYLVGDVLVDTGVARSAARIERLVGDRPVRAIALTHAHPDHAGSLRTLAERHGAPVWAGRLDREAVERGRPHPAAGRLGRLVARLGRFAPTPVARVLEDGDPLGDTGFVVLDTPGHSPGHIALWRASDGVLLCGDAIFGMSLRTTRPGLHTPPGPLTPDPVASRAAIRRLAALEPATVGFGHGPVLRDAAAPLRAFAARAAPGAG